jgi:phosphoenolpyruvate---glycerone phosphotransferase subunit DhaL
MAIDAAGKDRLVRALAGTVIAHADELTALDQAIGDGDHGLNMRRGFEAVLAELPGLADKPLPDFFKTIGMTMVMKVGGASGPLVGTFFMELGKALPPEPGRDALAAALDKAVAGVKSRGKSETGQKTLLDVIVPVAAAFGEGADGARLKALADEAAQATVPLQAIRGRASFLGERSVGHMDPGARSASLLIAAAVDALGA